MYRPRLRRRTRVPVSVEEVEPPSRARAGFRVVTQQPVPPSRPRALSAHASKSGGPTTQSRGQGGRRRSGPILPRRASGAEAGRPTDQHALDTGRIAILGLDVPYRDVHSPW